jgi:hypothetical protein
MGLREVESTLPPGFRFYPSDQELVCHYLYKKVANERASQGTLVEVDLHAREPWELPGKSLPYIYSIFLPAAIALLAVDEFFISLSFWIPWISLV